MFSHWNYSDLEEISALVQSAKRSNGGCKQCMTGARIGAICVPCEHAVMCGQCAEACLEFAEMDDVDPRCVKCRDAITGFVWL